MNYFHDFETVLKQLGKVYLYAGKGEQYMSIWETVSFKKKKDC